MAGPEFGNMPQIPQRSSGTVRYTTNSPGRSRQMIAVALPPIRGKRMALGQTTWSGGIRQTGPIIA